MASEHPADGLIYSQMRAMVSLMDRLRDFKLDELISLPKIAVLGTQSAGKSSLLEAICGINFLPRGSGIVTRRPLELRMVHKPVTDAYFVFPGEFNDKVFKNPEEVRKAIEELTDRVAGTAKGVSPIPIILTVYGPNVPDLTVIDLPGITKIAVDLQDKDIEKVTKELVRKYCVDPGVVILCVIPANIDLATSESLKFAMEIDPPGERTLGVLTKVDLMDEGTNAQKILLNKEIPLRYGYVAVKGRSQKETVEKMPVDQALQNEINFFAKHPSYTGLPSELLGTRSLVDKMSKILYKLISKSLPRIRDEMIAKKAAARKTLESLGTDFPQTDQEKLERVFELVQAFHDYLVQEITGRMVDQTKVRKLGTGKPPKASETIVYKFNQFSADLLSEYFDNGYRVSDDFTDEYISHAIATYQGENLPGFYSFDSFIFLINPKLQLLQTPTTTLLDEIKTVVEEKGLQIIDYFIGKHPGLAGTVRDILARVIGQRKNETRKVLERLIKCHENYFFTNDPAIMDLTVQLTAKTKNNRLTSGQLIILEMRARLDTYFRIVVRNLRDTVPKVIGSFFLRRLVESAKTDILQELNQKGYCLEVFKEPREIADQRKRARDDLTAISKAEDVLTGEFGLVFSGANGEAGKGAPDTAFGSGLEGLTMDDLATLDSEFLRISYNQMSAAKRNRGLPPQSNVGSATSRAVPVTPHAGPDKIESGSVTDNQSLNDSGLKKRYTLTGENEHTRYVLKEDAPLSAFSREDSLYNDARSAQSTPNVLQNQAKIEPKGPLAPPKNNQFDYDFTSGNSKKTVGDQMSSAKDAYNTYETVNKTFTKEEQKQIIGAGAQAYRYGQQNLTQEQVKTGVGYAVAGGKYVNDNFTKEQIISGARTAYDGAKYVANSSAGQKVIAGTKDLAAKGVDAAKNAEPPKKKNNLFGDFF